MTVLDVPRDADAGGDGPRRSGGDRAGQTRRVDPFLLPPSTTSSFLLLVVLTLAGAAYTAERLLIAQGGQDAWFEECTTTAAARVGAVTPARLVTEYTDCSAAAARAHGWSAVAVTVAIAVVVVGLAMLHPVVVRALHRLRPLRAEVYPAAAAEIAACVAESGLTRTPRFYVDPLRRRLGGRTFGFRPRYGVALSRTLLLDDDPESAAVLRAVVRHELAHIRNRDLELTALVVVAPVVYLATVLLPYAAMVAADDASLLWGVLWRMVVVLVVLLLVRAAVFRSREHHADVRASLLGTGDDPLPISAFPDDPRTTTAAAESLRRRLGDLVRAHPHGAARRDVVSEPARLLALRDGEAMVTGLTAAVAYAYLGTVVRPLTGDDAAVAGLISAVLVSLLVSSVVGVSTWRATLAALAVDSPAPSALRTGCALAAGYLLGDVLTPRHLSTWVNAVIVGPAAGVVSALTLAVTCAVWVRWTGHAATTWITGSRARSLRGPLEAGRLVGAALLGVLITTWATVTTGIRGDGRVGVFLYNLVTSMSEWAVLVVVLALGFLVMAGSARPHAWSAPRTLLLDAPRELVLPLVRVRPLLIATLTLSVVAVLAAVSLALGGDRFAALFSSIDLAGLQTGDSLDVTAVVLLLGPPALLVLAVMTVMEWTATDRTAPVGAGFAHVVVGGTLVFALGTFALYAGTLLRNCTVVVDCRTVPIIESLGANISTVAGWMALLSGAVVHAGTLALRALLGRRREPRRARPVTPGDAPRRRGFPTGAVLLTTCLVAVAVPSVLVGPSNDRVVEVLSVDTRAELASPTPQPRTTELEYCAQYREFAGKVEYFTNYRTAQLRMTYRAMLSDSPTLQAFGTAGRDAIAAGDTPRQVLVGRAVYPYCTRALLQAGVIR